MEKLCKSETSVATIAQALGVHRDTIYKELRRLGLKADEREAYNAEKAQLSL